MHSAIIQVLRNQSDVNPNFPAENICTANLPHVDYVEDSLSIEEKQQIINDLVSRILPQGMFSLNESGNSITYNGGIKAWKHHYANYIKYKAGLINEENSLDYIGPTYQLEKAIKNPLDTAYLFITDDKILYESADFMACVANLDEGDNLYFGNIFDYHF